MSRTFVQHRRREDVKTTDSDLNEKKEKAQQK